MVNVPVSASLWCRWRDAWVGPEKKKKCNPSLPSTGQQPSFSLEEMWNQRRTSLKEATVLRQEGTTGSRLNKVVALGGQNWCVKRKPSPSKVAAQPHTYSTARCTMGLSDRSLEKRPHVFGLSKLNGCTVLPVYPCIIKVHCYLFYWQLPILRACQRKAKTAARQSRKTTLVRRRGRSAGLKTKRERVAFGWEA